MHKSFVAAAFAAVLLASTASAQLPQGPITPQGPRLPEGTTPLIRPPCGGTVDLAITSVTLYKLSRPGNVRVEFDIYNLGPGEWNSSEGAQVANLSVRNGASGRVYTMTNVPIGGRRYARGARVGRVISTPIADAFDTFEFSGTVHAELAFDPDIAIDGNVCNDDSNPANNTFDINSDGVQAFLGGTARSRTFRR
jgi:hypothetical protein